MNTATQNPTDANQLAEIVLSMAMVTDMGLMARRLARKVIGIDSHGYSVATIPITTNGTTRLVPRDEPVFLLRAQDAAGADAVRAWADLAEKSGAAPDILASARAHADKMQAWPRKKTADLSEPLFPAGKVRAGESTKTPPSDDQRKEVDRIMELAMDWLMAWDVVGQGADIAPFEKRSAVWCHLRDNITGLVCKAMPAL